MMRVCTLFFLTLLGCGEPTEPNDTDNDLRFMPGDLIVEISTADHSEVLDDYGFEIVKALDEETYLVRGPSHESPESLLKLMQDDPRISSPLAIALAKQRLRSPAGIQREDDPLGFRMTDDAPGPPPIVGGDTTSDFEAVGAIVGQDRRRDLYKSFCSGTLIDDSTVLTAAHCVDGLRRLEADGWTDFEFVIGTTIHTTSGVWEGIAITETISHPDWDPSENIHDIALLRLARPSEVATPALLNQTIDPAVWLGEDIAHVGWGSAEDSDTDTSTSGVKRSLDVPVVAIYDTLLLTYRNDSRNLCTGDSGGAAFLTDATGQRHLAGVNAFILNIRGGEATCEGPDSAAGATRVDVYLDWIGTYVDLESPIRGDFNDDGVLDSADIDHFSYIRGGHMGPVSDDDLALMDLDNSGVLDSEDRRIWIEDIVGTRMGDVDLDLDVDTADITTLITNHWPDANACEAPSTPELCRVWADGDVDGDGDIDTSDITHAIINFHYGY